MCRYGRLHLTFILLESYLPKIQRIPHTEDVIWISTRSRTVVVKIARICSISNSWMGPIDYSQLLFQGEAVREAFPTSSRFCMTSNYGFPISLLTGIFLNSLMEYIWVECIAFQIKLEFLLTQTFSLWKVNLDGESTEFGGNKRCNYSFQIRKFPILNEGIGMK